jgi:HD-like signal output (HDOD) protein
MLASQVVVSAAVTSRVQQLCAKSPQELENLDAVRMRVEEHIARGLLAIPSLPTVAVRVVRSGTKNSANAHILADIIHADRALTEYVLRIASSAAKRPTMPIISLQHAIAWLGLDDVANIAFTLALQGKMLHVEGQHRKARRLWRHSLASALWARQLAHSLSRETGVCYLSGLLHNIGRAVVLGVLHDISESAGIHLAGNEYDCLVDVFQREVSERVIAAWHLPPPVPAVVARWDAYASAGALRWECNVVNLAHKLADFTLHEPAMLTRELLVLDQGYRDLGFASKDADPLFNSLVGINAELDRYLSP